MTYATPAVVAQEPSSAVSFGPGLLVNIDNGGTLTDICVLRGAEVFRTKTLTTPDDLSRCLFEGLRKVSREIYGAEDLQRLLLDTDYIRYSTTQGTNALVERKGPLLGLILLGDIDTDSIARQGSELFAALVGNRVVRLAAGQTDEKSAVAAVNQLTAAGANRLVVVGQGAREDEQALKSLLLRKFPPQMLGAVPILYAHEIAPDADAARVAWTAIFNAFLHPAMEHFLYNAEHQLRELKSQRPLLIFRNDGQAARVARTIAVKTYSSGPRGGAEGTIALARHYNLPHVISLDVGGTTSDIGVITNGLIRHQHRGVIEGVPTSFPLCELTSLGVGGGSIIRAENGGIRVGPESTGGAPGPACFGLGGEAATITDALLVTGLLDPGSYFGGEMQLDVERARKAIANNVGDPLGISVDEAAARMEAAWVEKVAAGIRNTGAIDANTALAAFGGGGPMLICKIAEAAGISTVLIPGLAAVFSAYGIGFSDIGHQYELPLTALADLESVQAELLEQARRGIFAEGFALEDCQQSWILAVSSAAGEVDIELDGDGLPEVPDDASLSVRLRVTRVISHALMHAQFERDVAAKPSAEREVIVAGAQQSLPLFRVGDLPDGSTADGPAVLEEDFFTARIDAGWRFVINAAGDIRLTRTAA